MKVRESALQRCLRLATLIGALTAWCAGAVPCQADVITDWDTKATAVASPAALGERELAIVDLAMFDAVNSVALSLRTLSFLPLRRPLPFFLSNAEGR